MAEDRLAAVLRYGLGSLLLLAASDVVAYYERLRRRVEGRAYVPI